MSKTAPSENILEFQDVGCRYAGGADVLNGLNFKLARGEMLFLTGPSGAGKSTALRLAAMQLRATRGRVLAAGAGHQAHLDLIEVAVDLVLALRLGLREVLQVHDAEGNVA